MQQVGTMPFKVENNLEKKGFNTSKVTIEISGLEVYHILQAFKNFSWNKDAYIDGKDEAALFNLKFALNHALKEIDEMENLK